MKKFTIFAVAMIIATMTIGGCTPKQTSEEITQFDIAIGETFTVTLESNPTTGYLWSAGFDDEMLEQEIAEFIPADNPELVGAGGEQVFTFRGISAGVTELTLKYMRPWESVQPIDERTYTVTISE